MEGTFDSKTMEEASERYAISQGYSEKDYKDPNSLFNEVSRAVRVGAVWQSKRMYSEQEVLQLLLKLKQTETYDNLYDWFQQNKKKI